VVTCDHGNMLLCSSSRWRARLLLIVHGRGAESKVATKTNKVVASEGLCKDVRDVVNRADSSDSELMVSHQITDRVIFYANVFYLWVPNVILSQTTRRVVVAVE
jgi:hypothetical protein